MINYREEYQKIGEELIEKLKELEPIKESDCRVGFMGSSKAKKSKGRKVFAECKKMTGEINELFVPHDFLIIVYEPNCRDFTINQLKILLWHELKHVEASEKNGEWKFGIVPHDLADFRTIINMVGARWDEPGANVIDITRGEDE